MAKNVKVSVLSHGTFGFWGAILSSSQEIVAPHGHDLNLQFLSEKSEGQAAFNKILTFI